MKKVISMSIFIFSVAFGAQEEVIWNGAKIGTDSIYYHSYHQDGPGSSVRFLPAQHNWVFVKFTPICRAYTVQSLPFAYQHRPLLQSNDPGTLCVWIDTVLPANLEVRVFFYEPQNGSPPEWNVGSLPLTVDRDFWVGYCGSFGTNPGGTDTIFTTRDGSAPGTPGRNFYSLTGCYGTLQPYSDYDFIITSVGDCVADVEESQISNPQFPILTVYPNPFTTRTVIKFSIPNSQFSIHIYDLTGRLINSINSINSITWDGKDDKGKEVEAGIYFLQLRRVNANRTCKLVKIK